MVQNKNYEVNKIGKKICLLSDIHYSKNYDLTIFDEIIKNITENKPDYICIPGDLVDDVTYLYECPDELTKFIKKLSLIAPVIISKGNHDETKFDRYNPNYLTNEQYFLNLNTIENVYYLNNKSLVRDNIVFTGFNLSYGVYYNKPHEDSNKFIKELDKLPKIDTLKYNILLCHTPTCILTDKVLNESKLASKFDLILSGHMHNGLVFKFLDRKSNRGFAGPFRSFFPKYAKGILTKEINNKKISLVICGGTIKFAENNPNWLKKFNKLYYINIDYINV